LKNLTQVKIIDASWDLFHPEWKQDFETKRIPNAIFFDIDEIADHSTELPHMIPSISDFEQTMDKLGISNDDHIVVYDKTELYNASARVWWTFKVFGHDRVSILEGGLKAWEKENGPLDNSIPKLFPKSGFKASFRPQLVADFQKVRAGNVQIVDNRSSGRFEGLEPEPRPNVRRGRISGSKNLPYFDLLIPLNGGPGKTFLSKELIKEMLIKKNIDLNKDIILSCGSGVTAAVAFFGLHLLGKECSLYDGSWTEYSTKVTE